MYEVQGFSNSQRFQFFVLRTWHKWQRGLFGNKVLTNIILQQRDLSACNAVQLGTSPLTFRRDIFRVEVQAKLIAACFFVGYSWRHSRHLPSKRKTNFKRTTWLYNSDISSLQSHLWDSQIQDILNTGFGFIDHLYKRLGSVSNYRATANVHSSQITTSTKSFPDCSVYYFYSFPCRIQLSTKCW
jgi:hypothetical protein